MTHDYADLALRAKRRLRLIERRRRDPRFTRVLGRLSRAGYLTTNFEVEPHEAAISVADALWVGEVEPRVLELLPALLVNSPSLFENTEKLPADLAEVVLSLRRGELPNDFRGIPGRDVMRRLARVEPPKAPSRLKAFRLRPPELALLGQLSARLGVTETEVIRSGLRELAAKHLDAVSSRTGAAAKRRRTR